MVSADGRRQLDTGEKQEANELRQRKERQKSLNRSACCVSLEAKALMFGSFSRNVAFHLAINAAPPGRRGKVPHRGVRRVPSEPRSNYCPVTKKTPATTPRHAEKNNATFSQTRTAKNNELRSSRALNNRWLRISREFSLASPDASGAVLTMNNSVVFFYCKFLKKYKCHIRTRHEYKNAHERRVSIKV